MSPSRTAVVASSTDDPLSSEQTLRAAKALLSKIQADDEIRKSTAAKTNLLADADDEEAEDSTPVWLILTTKKHVVDQKRLKPTKISLPHPLVDVEDKTLRICLITADPQRKYKDLIAEPSFPLDLGQRLQKVIGLEKLKARYKSYESRRQLFAEYDIFLADDRVITYLPKVLGKVFYKSGAKRPIPVTLEGRRQSKDEQGNKRRKLSEGGSKAIKDEIKPADAGREIERTLGSALVHLSPSVTTAVKVGKAEMEPAQLQANVEAVVRALADRSVPQKWRNVRSIHIKGPNTVALPIWMTDELWADEEDVLDEAPPVKVGKKRARALLEESTGDQAIVIPGPDGKMRTLVPTKKKAKTDDVDSGEQNAAWTKARKELLEAQKAAAKKAAV
nr:putative ribosome biogenesis protein c8f11.04 [Quercus suber]